VKSCTNAGSNRLESSQVVQTKSSRQAKVACSTVKLSPTSINGLAASCALPWRRCPNDVAMAFPLARLEMDINPLSND
jgi:hypothetical protein